MCKWIRNNAGNLTVGGFYFALSELPVLGGGLVGLIYTWYEGLPQNLVVLVMIYSVSLILYIFLSRREKKKELEKLENTTRYQIKKYWDIEYNAEIPLARAKGNLHEMTVFNDGKKEHIKHPSGDHWSNRCTNCGANPTENEDN